MNRLEFNEMVKEFGEDVYSFEKFLKKGFVLEASYITIYNELLKDINYVTFENNLLKDAIEKLSNNETIDSIKIYLIDNRKKLNDSIAQLVARDTYYKKVYDSAYSFLTNENEDVEALYRDYCLNHHPAVRAFISKQEEKLSNYLKKEYFENNFNNLKTLLEKNQGVFINDEIGEDKFNDISAHYFKLRKNMNVERAARLKKYPFVKENVFKDELSIASEEADLRVQLKKLKDLNEALHKDYVSAFGEDFKL